MINIENEVIDPHDEQDLVQNIVLSNEIVVPDAGTAAGNATKRKSLVWSHATKLNSALAKCTICNKEIKTKYGNTSALMRHLKASHQIAFVSTDDPSGSSTQADDRAQKKDCYDKNSARAKKITSAITYMMAKDLQPYSIVNYKGWKNLVHVLDPRYEILSRTTFSRTLLPELYVSVHTNVSDTIKLDMNEGVQTLAFTTVGWTSRAVDNYMSLMVHYLTDDSKNQHFVLNIWHSPFSHAAQNIRSFLKELMQECGFSDGDHNIYFVMDNARNIVKAIQDEEKWNRIPCFAHTLQLVVKDLSSKNHNFIDLCKRCRQIVGLFSRSAKARTALIEAQKWLDPEAVPRNLVQDVQTQWNSEHDMLQRLLRLRKPLSIVLCERSMPDNFSNAEWDMLEAYVNELELLKEATVAMSGEKYPTLSYYIPILLGIISAVKEIMAAERREIESDHTDVEGMEAEIIETVRIETETLLAGHLHDALQHRFSAITSEDCFMIAMLMDPRFKNRLCSSAEEKQSYHELVRSTVIASATSAAVENDDPFSRRHDSEGEPVSKLRKFLTNLFVEENGDNLSIASKVDRKLQMDFHERVVSLNTHILKW